MAEEEQDTAVHQRGPRERTRGRRRPGGKTSSPSATHEHDAGQPSEQAPAASEAEHELTAPAVEQDAAAKKAKPAKSEAPGMLKVLWADIRGKRLPRQPTAQELEWEAEDEAEEAAARANYSPGTDLTDDHMERWRRRTMSASE
ncbi:MAG: hypothetical protein ACRDZW_04670 [Acidimicrobiales bacterium]